MKTSLLFLVSVILAMNVDAQFWQGKDASFPRSLWGESVYAISEHVAWTYGVEVDVNGQTFKRTTISKTDNGGNSWYNVVFPNPGFADVSSMWAYDYDTAWMTLVEFPSLSSLEGTSYLYKTTDGGFHWDTLPIAIHEYLNFVYMWDAREGILLGDPYSGTFEITKTYDGGHTWIPVKEIPPALEFEYVYKDNYVVHGDQCWFLTTSGRVFSSITKGESWTVIEGPAGAVGLADHITANARGDLYLVYHEYHEATGYAAEIWKRDHVLDSWVKVLDEDYFIYNVCNIPGTDALIISTATNDLQFSTWLSQNNGSSWLMVDTTALANDISFFNPEVGYASQVKWYGLNTRSMVYRYAGSPITGLVRQETLPGASLSVYPAPAHGSTQIAFESAHTDPYCLLVHDMQGNLMHRESYEKTGKISANLYLENWPPGKYTVTVVGEQGSIVKSFVKL